MRPREWMRKFLESRDLEVPDGRPLYQYRLSDSEFSELFETLKFTTQFGIQNIPSMLTWDAAFVLYASEWWRREYCGHWGWADIFGSIGADYQELPVGARNDLVESGLRRWRRKVRSSSKSRNFLGTIATEGGLPLHQLSGTDSGGWLRHVLQPVLRKHIEKGHSFSRLIEAYIDLIPRSYRSAELSEILEDIAEAVVMLRNDHNLAGKDSPIRWLDKNQPQWREVFPLPVDDSAARSLLKDLVDTAAKAKTDFSTSEPFECYRILVNAEFANPELLVQIELPAFITLKSLGLDQSGDLPSTLELEVFEPGGKSWPWCRAVLTTFKNERALKLSGRNFQIKGKDATSELKVRLKFRGQSVLETDVSKGELVDPDLPWMFKKIDEKWNVHGTASQSVKDSEAFLYVPEGFDFEEEDETSSVSALAPFLAGKVWRLNGSVFISNGIDKYHMGTGGEESSDVFQLRGQKFPYLSTPREVFIGAPLLYQKNQLTGKSRRRYDSRVLAKPVGRSSDGWRPLGELNGGVYVLRALDEANNILFSRTIGILNKEYRHSLRPDREDVCRGSIHISGASEMEMGIRQPGVETGIEDTGQDIKIDLLAYPQPPKSLEVSLLAPRQGRNLILSFPFPSRGAILFDAAENLVSPDKTLNLDDLHGHRIRVFNDKSHLASRFALTISLKDRALSHSDQRDIYIKVPLKLDGEYSELAVTDWLPMIRSIFGAAKSLDASVQISLTLEPNTLLALNIRRYAHFLTREQEEGSVEIASQDLENISIETLGASKILALNMFAPNMEPVALTPRSSEGVQVGCWDFVPRARQSGPWLIYPDSDSQLQFRPLLWTVGLNTDEPGDSRGEIRSLAEAIAIPNEAYRRDAIASELLNMASQHDHKNWHYLEELWQRTSHLPVVTFDIWLVAIQVPVFLAALFIKDRFDILSRLEDELPLIWELVSKNEWEQALLAYKSRLEQHLGDDVELVDDLLKQVIDKISSHTTSMLSMGMILNSSIRGEESPSLRLMAYPADVFLKPEMESLFQDLFRRQAEQEWPSLMRSQLSARFRMLPEDFQSLVNPRHNYQKSVVCLPFILAWSAIVGDNREWCGTSSQIFKILQIKMFDEDWFNGAFQYLSGWLSQQQLIE